MKNKRFTQRYSVLIIGHFGHFLDQKIIVNAENEDKALLLAMKKTFGLKIEIKSKEIIALIELENLNIL